jgi:hypothetical protein
MIFYRPHGLVGERWAINREVSGSILSPKSVWVEGGAPGTAGGWMTVLMKSQGRLTRLSSSFAFISFGLTQKKKNKNLVFTYLARCLSHGGPFI